MKKLPTPTISDSANTSPPNQTPVPEQSGQSSNLPGDLKAEIAQIVRTENSQLLREHLSLKPLLTLKDVARTLKVSNRTVETLVAAGDLRPLWIKGQRRFHPDTIAAYIHAREVKR